MPHRTYGLGAAQVYHCYDGEELLYIGATTSLGERLNAHLVTTEWASRVDRVETTDHPTLQAAREVESADIYNLRPRWNIHGRGGRAGWGLSDYVEVALATAARSDQAWNADNSARKVDRLLREMRRRFPDVADKVIADITPYVQCVPGGAA